LHKICLTNGSDVFLTGYSKLSLGNDKVLKRYKFPEENLLKIDLKLKIPAPSPVEEQEGQQLPSTCICLEKDFIV